MGARTESLIPAVSRARGREGGDKKSVGGNSAAFFSFSATLRPFEDTSDTQKERKRTRWTARSKGGREEREKGRKKARGNGRTWNVRAEGGAAAKRLIEKICGRMGEKGAEKMRRAKRGRRDETENERKNGGREEKVR
jgi:hypothetical protein